ncbi:hypothetical protein F53441_897 [Fusarium austroafricanum]|uniref:Uncharacterized protein n=1 Tax=Fusarium austroafricanum TaxID=2364996 RepID=A0A8H4NZM4_9HYPO|nr:hypothetical protein F53441_897 [Fusarium austroafricanum]
MSTTKDNFELACDKVFAKLKELAQELKKHAHEEVHFNIEHAVQYVEHDKTDLKFKERIRVSSADISRELVTAINDCTKNLNECLSICRRMGTPAWNPQQDARLTMTWNFFYANLSKAGLILQVPLDASAFLAFQRQANFEPPTFSRRESFASMGNASENFTMEGRDDRRERAQRRRQEPVFTTPTGTRLRPSRPHSMASSRHSTASSSSSSTARPTPQSTKPETWVVDPSLVSTPSNPPPPYTPMAGDTKQEVPPVEKPRSIPPTPAPSVPPMPAKSIRSVASEPQLAAPGPTSHHTHYTGNVFHIYQGIPAGPPPQIWQTPQLRSLDSNLLGLTPLASQAGDDGSDM